MKWGSVDWTLGCTHNPAAHCQPSLPDSTRIDYAPNPIGQKSRL